MLNWGKNEGNFKNYSFNCAFLFTYFIWSEIMKIFDLFSGCGGFRLAAELNGFKSVGYAEINKYAIEFYNNVFEGETFPMPNCTN